MKRINHEKPSNDEVMSCADNQGEDSAFENEQKKKNKFERVEEEKN